MDEHQPRHPPQLLLDSLLPIRSVIVVLKATETSRPGFFHQPSLAAFLRGLLRSPPHFDRQVRLDSPETGRIFYQPGQYYRFQIHFLGDTAELVRLLFHKLEKLPESASRNHAPLPFRDNWRLYSLQDGFSGQPVATPEELSTYGPEELEKESRLWRGHVQVRW